jgi:hypothetical protein
MKNTLNGIFFFFFLCWDRTQVLMQARQVLYHQGTSQPPLNGINGTLDNREENIS